MTRTTTRTDGHSGHQAESSANGGHVHTPYLNCSLSWMAGGKLPTCTAHPCASCCLKPTSSYWNMEFSSADGLFHLTIALQNHNRLCQTRTAPCQATRVHIPEQNRYRTLAMPAGFVCTSVHSPRKAESFSSLSLISCRAEHHAWANSGSRGATRRGCMRPMRPIDTAAFSCKLRGALGWRRIGINLETRGCTQVWNSGSSGATTRQRKP